MNVLVKNSSTNALAAFFAASLDLSGVIIFTAGMKKSKQT
jgi:hypothetical protein